MDRVMTPCEWVLWEPILKVVYRLKLREDTWSLVSGPDEDSLSTVPLEGVQHYHESMLTAVLYDGRLLVIPSTSGKSHSRPPSIRDGDNIYILDVVSYVEEATCLPE